MAHAINRPMTALEWGLLGILSVLWGGTFFFMAVALTGLPPFLIVFGRIAGAALILLGVMRLTGAALPGDARAWLAIAVMSVLNNVVPFSLFAWGQTQVASGLAAILNATTPVFAVIVAHLLTADEKMTGNRLAGVGLGLSGVAVMVGPSAFGSGGSVWGQLACLGGALSYAFSGIQGRRLAAFGLSPLASATGQVTVSAILLLPITLAVDRPWTLPVPSPAVLLSWLALASLSTALAYVIFFRILASAGATNLLLVTFLIPVSAVLLGTGLLGERLELRQVAGMALIAGGLAAIDGRLFRRLRPAPG